MQSISFIFAYIDPGAGLLVWQALAAMFLGLAFYIKSFRTYLLIKVQALFRQRKKAGEETISPETTK